MPEPEAVDNEVVVAEEVNPYMDYLMALADEIGQKIERGQLPPKDENGFYIL
jgi:hypothetical protein